MYNSQTKQNIYIGKRVISQRRLIKDFSLQQMEDVGWDMADTLTGEDIASAELQKEQLIRSLTNRQQLVVQLLVDGFARKEIAGELKVSLQAIHQIILRIRKRITSKGMARA